jgi:predicted ATPase
MSKKTVLKKLKVHALRGATQALEIEFHKPLTLIYGENGTGKSTIWG